MKLLNKSQKKYLILLIIFAAIIRFGFVLNFPPVGQNMVWPRLFNVIVSLFTIWGTVHILIRKKISYEVALITGFVMTITPWHIENSRIYSPAMIGLGLILTMCLVLDTAFSRIVKISLILLTGALIAGIFDEIWFLHIDPSNGKILENIIKKAFHFVSAEWLFYKNETFWAGGLRTGGVFLPGFIPFYIVGIFLFLKKFNKKNILPTVIFILWCLVAAANPSFPEGRELFFLLPVFCYLVAQGVLYLVTKIKNKNILYKAALLIYFIFLSYEYLVYTHYYIYHYSQRIKNEIPYAEISF